MSVPQHIVDHYGVTYDGALDADVVVFLQHFAGLPPQRVLVAGCLEECTANMLAAWGMEVVGFDLREYPLEGHPPCNYRFVRGDFCRMDLRFMQNYEGKFDHFVSLSALEHFGVGAYDCPDYHPFYDHVAMRLARRMLKVGGHAYVTVPYGKEQLEHLPHWRVYDAGGIKNRLVCRMAVTKLGFFTSGPCTVAGRQRGVLEALTQEEADSYDGREDPHVTAFLELVKDE